MRKILFYLVLISISGMVFANSVLKTPKNYTVFLSKNNEYTIANERKTPAVVKTGLVKINSSQLVCADKNCRNLKGMVFHTANGLRIAVVNINKLKSALKYNPQWMANLNKAAKVSNSKYYYINVSPSPQVWLGVANAKIAQVAIRTK
jgi:hypothetical protein